MSLTGAAWYLVIALWPGMQWQVPFAFSTRSDCIYAATHLYVAPPRTTSYACVPYKWSFLP